jgi:hypothetical protein
MADKSPQRISIGFHASPPLGLRVTDEVLDRLLKALPAGEWHDLETDDGAVTINLSQVIYVRTERDEHRVGFGLAS